MTDTNETSRLRDEREHLYARITELEQRHAQDAAAIREHQRISNNQLETIRELRQSNATLCEERIALTTQLEAARASHANATQTISICDKRNLELQRESERYKRLYQAQLQRRRANKRK